MTIDWLHAWPTALAAFLASAVEFVEALTMVLAVGAVRGWRSALAGTAAALALLLGAVLLFGPLLTRIPLEDVQLVVGGLLLLFGLRWLRKAVLRAAGIIALHDEAAAYARETGSLRLAGPSSSSWDAVAIATAFKITMLEGLEVVFIVIAVGAGGVGLLVPAGIGAVVALLAVGVLGLVLHRPLSMVPENTLKFLVGVLLAAFGTFWVGEGLRLTWPGGDWSILGLTLGYQVSRRSPSRRVGVASQPVRPRFFAKALTMNALKTILRELVSLFVDDVGFATAIVSWIALAWLLSAFALPPSPWVAALLFAGLGAILLESALRRAGAAR